MLQVLSASLGAVTHDGMVVWGGIATAVGLQLPPTATAGIKRLLLLKLKRKFSDKLAQIFGWVSATSSSMVRHGGVMQLEVLHPAALWQPALVPAS
jgi:hypothetical protein